ncbi:MAG: hypothetical protein CMA63_05560 [Euryarchaeota archaeon]|nr:hypothetical protein [Euryarchaeota archaeon]|tara:strand:+ start:17585 stop:20668 length:3084 start_codon:yes stop_codon:yes gene_type:complete
MRKTTPMILVALMLVSALSGFNVAELEENVVIEDTGARAGADAEMVAITNPKETVCNQATCRNVMKVGEETTFSAYIQNSGDADITEMTYTVTVYLSDAAGNPSMVAKDSTGQDLTWTNNDVICANAQLCDFGALGSGDVLGGGKLTLTSGGNDIVWSPIQGLYVIQIVVDASPDVDAGNDAQSVFVSVENWYDIELDLSWLDADGNPMEGSESGTDTKNWQLTVKANGSDTFDPREVTVGINTVGNVLAAQTTDGTSIDGGSVNNFVAGTVTTVDVFENVSTDPPVITPGSRTVLSYMSTWTLTGSLSVDASNENADYGMKASLISYDMYGMFVSCQETNASDVNETWDHSCEESTTSDAYSSNNDDSIDGFASVFHDIRISQMTVVQGFNADGTGQGTSMVSDDTGGELNVGASYLLVQVEHRGSDQSNLYDWNVTMSMTDSAGVVTTAVVDSCEAIEPAYVHAQLGMGQAPVGEQPPNTVGSACMMVTLSADGDHTFSAQLHMEEKTTDARPGNNDRDMTLNVRNNAPLILSLDLLNDGELFTGQEDLLSMAISVFDVDDPSGTGIQVEWRNEGTALPGCERSIALTCSVIILDEYVTAFPVSVTVFDAHGGETSEELMLSIWNNGGASATTDSGLTLEYAIQYFAVSAFTLTATDGELNDYANTELPGYSGTYNAVGAIDYVPGTTYSAGDVLSQSMSVHYAKSLEATSLWYVSDGGMWTLISDASTDVDATTGSFAYTFPSSSPVLAQGSLVLMGGSLAQADVPDAIVTGFSAAAAKSGEIQLNWNINGTMLADDSIDITICEGAAGCDDPFTAGLAVGATSYKYSDNSIAHGTSLNVHVAVCNEIGCSSPVGSADVVVDRQVDGDVSATDLTVSAMGDEWTVAWTATGDQSDVAEWNVCWQKNTFDAANMPANCETTPTTSATFAMPMSPGTFTYHFTAVPVDALGNSAAAGSMNSIDYQRDADNSNVDDNTDIIGDDAAASGVPTWTWGVIGGVVVVAFIVGAFILSRGGDGDEGKDWDY